MVVDGEVVVVVLASVIEVLDFLAELTVGGGGCR